MNIEILSKPKDIKLPVLAREIQGSGMEIASLKDRLESCQDELITNLCGKRYQRWKTTRYKRAGTTRRTFMTRLGEVELRVNRVKDLATGKTSKPLLELLGIKGKERFTRDVKRDCISTVIKETYRETQETIAELTRSFASKSMIHSWIREIGDFFMKKNQEYVKGHTQSLVTGDGTKTHGISKGEKNEVNVVLGQNKQREKSLIAVRVNRPWDEVGEEVKKLEVVGRNTCGVADGEKAIQHALAVNRKNFQLCVRHAIDGVRYKLWDAGMPKWDRDPILGDLKRILYTLRNSVIRHLEDKDFQRLERRIDRTLKELKQFAEKMKRRGYDKVDKFVENSANYLVTFARLAMKGVTVPYTNNLIERLMGAIAKRVKNRWAHWSTSGLESLLNILLVKYTNRDLYQRIWDEWVYGTGTLGY